MECEYQPACPGCPRYGKAELAPERIHQLNEIAAIWQADVEPECISFDGMGSRYRARLSVRGEIGRLRIGIFEQGSHRLVSIPRCTVHHAAIAGLLSLLVCALNEATVSAYDEDRHTGELRAVQLAVEPATEKVQVVLLINRDLLTQRPSKELLRACDALAAQDVVQGVFLGALPDRGNSLFPQRILHLSGAPVIEDECGGARVFFPPGAFGQANPVLHRRVADTVQAFATDSSRIVEYYAGVGTLGLGLAALGKQVVFNEVGEGSIAGLEMGWAALGRRERLTVAKGRAGDHAEIYEASDTVIVDPPRKGLDRALLRRLISDPPRRLIYLSCGIDALLRESREFVRARRLTLEHLSGWAYFPFTDHVETLLVATRID